MDDFEMGSRPDERQDLTGWALALDCDGGLLLGLKYAAYSQPDASEDRQLQLLLPPEAALHLSRELARQATQILEGQRLVGAPRLKT